MKMDKQNKGALLVIVIAIAVTVFVMWALKHNPNWTF